jgi:hypothetical protein
VIGEGLTQDEHRYRQDRRARRDPQGSARIARSSGDELAVAAVNAGAAVIRDEARAIAPEYTGEVSEGHPPPGTLRRSIVLKAIRELSTYYRRVYFVTVRRGKKYQKQGKVGNLSQDAYLLALGRVRPLLCPAQCARFGA